MILKDAFVSINGVDLSDHVQQVQLSPKVDALDDTAMGDDTHSRAGGLKDWTVSIDFYQDYAAGSVDATLFPLVGTVVPIEIRPTSAAASATNPSYTGNGLLESYDAVSGNVGQVQMSKASISAAGTLSRATA